MRDAGWDRGRHRQEAHFPVLALTDLGARTLKEVAPLQASMGKQPQVDSSERARALAMKVMVQGAFALQDWKHERIEAADFVRESPCNHLVLFAMERHPGGRRVLCLYLWHQRSNRVHEIEMVSAWRVSNVKTWFERKLEEYRQKSNQP